VPQKIIQISEKFIFREKAYGAMIFVDGGVYVGYDGECAI
jgi:hypothetical protein